MNEPCQWGRVSGPVPCQWFSDPLTRPNALISLHKSAFLGRVSVEGGIFKGQKTHKRKPHMGYRVCGLPSFYAFLPKNTDTTVTELDNSNENNNLGRVSELWPLSQNSKKTMA